MPEHTKAVQCPVEKLEQGRQTLAKRFNIDPDALTSVFVVSCALDSLTKEDELVEALEENNAWFKKWMPIMEQLADAGILTKKD